jgi:hypothetical protein
MPNMLRPRQSTPTQLFRALPPLLVAAGLITA